MKSRLPMTSVAALLALGGSACSEGNVDACSQNSECGSGEICDGGCRTVCVSSANCGANEVCSDGVCQAGRSDVSPPRIEAIDGDGSADGEAGRAEHRVDRRLFVIGEGLANATASLTDGTTTWPLDICERSSARLAVALPQGLGPGAYQLNVSNPGGNCGATLNLVEGPLGPSGPTGPNGPVGATGPALSTSGDFVGDGSEASPLALDPTSDLAWLHQTAQLLEAEELVPAEQRGSVESASKGAAFFGDKLVVPITPNQTLWSLDAAVLGRPLASARVLVTLRVGLSDVQAPPPILATLRCFAQRLGTTSSVEVGRALPLRPSEFPPWPAFLEVGTACDFSPTDLQQRLVVDGFQAGVASVWIDTVRFDVDIAPIRYITQRIVATSGTGHSLCGALGGVCISALSNVMGSYSGQPICIPSVYGVLDDCAMTLSATCAVSCSPSKNDGCSGRQPSYVGTGGSAAPPQVVCLVPNPVQ